MSYAFDDAHVIDKYAHGRVLCRGLVTPNRTPPPSYDSAGGTLYSTPFNSEEFIGAIAFAFDSVICTVAFPL